MLKKVRWFTLVIFFMMGCLCFGSSQQAPTPEPPHIAVHVPDPSLPAQIKSLLGKWAGQWNSRWGWDTIMYVEKVDKDSAQVALAWGEYSTSRNSCHCNPNWVRVQNAKVKYTDDGGVTLEFYTPKFRPGWLEKRHTVTGSAEETHGRVDRRTTGVYSYSFVLDKDDPDTMKGLFISAGMSHLHADMKRVKQDKDSEQ